MRTNWRVAVPLFWSALTTAVVLSVISTIAKSIYFSKLSLNSLFIWINYYIGYPDIYYLTALPLFMLSALYFFKREKDARYHRYLIHIIEDVQRIADGDFDHKVPVQSIGELGQLAGNINQVVERLKTSIDEERRAESTKNELITNVSHDLRTPLTSITGYLGLIEQDRYRDEVELRYYVNMAYEESQRLFQLIQDLFEYTRLSNITGATIQKAPINLVEMMRQLSAQFRLQLQEAGIEQHMTFFESQMLVMADGNKLRRVFENLISNAIKYGSEGKYLEVMGFKEGDEAVIQIINYGDTIPQTDLPHIFDRFYRVEKSRATHTGGSGIGLAIAKSIVELHGGTISASSDEERTVFTVRLNILGEKPNS
ncbi:sensor histidine kinase [Paenibacillus tyrfis]|uniref:sensor histidine kinase n=1 Tax=Paenibacillus tyrfis TaxID=1501230 RepID=UPI00209DB075|nr:HAMP domain-containing sensor histidine kinase [Paenibacillus tyrfis]MCP1306503.1 HAMP domain-containing histidine kinase [Paenibacillus tyrfis]